MDWDALERARHPATQDLPPLPSAQPVARVWRPEELARLVESACGAGIILCSDEIHCDLILDPARGSRAATPPSGPEIAARTVTLMAPSKTYNVPGLGTSFAVIPDPRCGPARPRLRGIVAEVNALGYAACEAAYRDGEPWRLELLPPPGEPRSPARPNSPAISPGIRVDAPIEATYLAWLNVEALGLDDPVGHFEAHGVGLSDGRDSGPPGRHVRLNFGCPRGRPWRRRSAGSARPRRHCQADAGRLAWARFVRAMKDLQAIVRHLAGAGPGAAGVLATLVAVEGSSYRRPGARMLFAPGGGRIGSISGGCLEEDLSERAGTVARTGRAETVVYDTTSENDLIWGVGTGCHGVVRLLIEPLPRPTGLDRDPRPELRAGQADPARGRLGGLRSRPARHPAVRRPARSRLRRRLPRDRRPGPEARRLRSRRRRPAARQARLGARLEGRGRRPAAGLRHPRAVPRGRRACGRPGGRPGLPARSRTRRPGGRHDPPLRPRRADAPGAPRPAPRLPRALGPEAGPEKILSDLAADGFAISPDMRRLLHAPVGWISAADTSRGGRPQHPGRNARRPRRPGRPSAPGALGADPRLSHGARSRTAAPRFGAVILAAGASTRMGSPKQLLDVGGRPLVARAAEAALASCAWPVVVVLGAHADRIRPALARLPVLAVDNPAWTEGMASSIRAGMAALGQFSRSLDGAVLALCDQPAFSAGGDRRARRPHRATGRGIAAARYGGRHGAPALFLRAHFRGAGGPHRRGWRARPTQRRSRPRSPRWTCRNWRSTWTRPADYAAWRP